ncbi:MAG: filamentous hemagglutinin N-terminal domain-containing protein [Phormidium sp.]
MKPSPSLFYIAQSSALLTLLAAHPATAQIIPDNTVNTTVTPNGNINVIEGGTRAGSNLFHSFQEFSVPTGREAFFNNAFDVRNIFSRVTGKLPSNIDGLIRANGVANLFLLNPNGIIFGPNARLNIGGSFLATTANSFKFADGSEFSATNPQTAPLLSINVPIGLQMGANPGNITVNATGLNRPLPVEGETLEQRVARGIAFEEEVLNNLQGLQVQPGKTIGLVGGNLTFNGGLVTVRQGRIELGSVNSGVVNLNPTETGFVLGYENISNFGEIQMSQSSAVAASGEGAGEIRVRGGKITLNEISSIGANTIGNENGKSVTVEAEQLSVFGGSFLVSGTFSSGDAGNLIVKAKDSIEVSGISADGKFLSTLQTFSLAGGKAGNLTIDTGRLTVQDGASISTGTSSKGQGGNLTVRASQEVQVNGTSANGKFSSTLTTLTNGAGNAGDMTIQTGRLTLRDGAFVSTDTRGTGNGGNLLVQAKDSVEVVGTMPNGLSTSLSAGVGIGEGSRGSGGKLTIETGTLSIRDGGSVSTATWGQGNAGNLLVKATDLIEVVGEGPVTPELPNGILSSLNSDVVTDVVGNGGNLTVETQRLSVRDGGQVSTRLYGQGKGGTIQVKASELVEVVGAGRIRQSQNGKVIRISSGINADVGGGVGSGGDINIDTQVLSLRDGGQVTAAAFGIGDAGNIQVQASKSVEVVGAANFGNVSTIGTDVLRGVAGQGGDINIDTQVLSLREGGEISAGTAGIGNSGNIYIRAKDRVEVDGATSDNQIVSGIYANVFSGAKGNGGNITVETRRLTIGKGFISTSTYGDGNAGDILLQASEAVELSNDNLISAITSKEATGNGGKITIETQRLQLVDNSDVVAFSLGQGKGGTITIRASESVLVSDTSGLSTFTNSTGDAGDIIIETGQLIVQNPGRKISANSNAEGKGGNIKLQANQLIVRNGAQVIVTAFGAGKAGNLTVIAEELEVVGTSADGRVSGLFANTEGTGDAGNLTIETQKLTISDGGQISATTFNAGKAGSLTVKADVVNVIGRSADGKYPSGLFTDTTGTGDAGNLIIETQQLTVQGGAQITATTLDAGKGGSLTITADVVQIGSSTDGQFLSSLLVTSEGTGDGGNLSIQTKQLILQGGAQISASNFGAGKAGNLTVKADVAEVIGTSPDEKFPSGLFANTDGTGDGGNLSIETQQLTVRDGAQILAGTDGAGKGGNLTVKADVVEVIGGAASGKSASSLSTSSEGTGNAGNLTINTRNFIVRDGAQVAAGTFGSGKAGNFKITAELIEVAGKAPNAKYSGLFVTSEEGSGDAGNLTINTGRLIVRDGARVTASSFGTGAAGNLEVTANSIFIDNGGILRATTASGNQGNINLLSSSLIMRRGSNITTNATGKATGGNIIINTDVLAALENSDISANAEDSFGGRVIINAQGIFGTKFRPDNTPESDITATSKLGPQFSGSVQINTPEVDPNSGLVNFPENAVDVSRLVPKGCVARRKETGTFYITGNGGFQYRPGDGLMSPLPTGEVRSIPENNSFETSEVNGRIIEAQGVYKLENGQMVLGWECPEQ